MQLIFNNKVYNTESSECFGAIYTWLTEYQQVNYSKIVKISFFYKTDSDEYFIHSVPGRFALATTEPENILVIEKSQVKRWFGMDRYIYPITIEIFNQKIFKNL